MVFNFKEHLDKESYKEKEKLHILMEESFKDILTMEKDKVKVKLCGGKIIKVIEIMK